MSKKPGLDIVIPAAGLGRRMPSYGPKSLINVGGEPLIGRQVRMLKEAFPRSRVFVVLGHEASRVRRALPGYARVVLNRDYESSNVACSLALALARTEPGRSALIVYGDLAFNRAALAGLCPSCSSVVVDRGEGRDDEVGLNIDAGYAEHFSYGLPAKWAHIAMLAPPEKALFLEAAGESSRSRHFGFEILNAVIDAGGSFLALQPEGLWLVEIDTARDIEAVRLRGAA